MLITKHLNIRTISKIFISLVLFSAVSYAQTRMPIPFFDIGVRSAENAREVSLSLQVLFLLSILILAPSIIIMTTSFIRVSIVLKFAQRGLSLQQSPPNQVIMGLALFITFFIMSPTIEKIYDEAYKPFSRQKITTEDFFEKSSFYLKEFMHRQVRESDVALFVKLAKEPPPKNKDEVKLVTLIPAFVISEITQGFKIGILIFIPFIVVDMIVASILMSMGMIMVPPIMISLPFKLILFVLFDGWHMITYQVVQGFA